jgi:hypothetical protein
MKKILSILLIMPAVFASSSFAQKVEFVSYRGPQRIVLGNGRVDRTYVIPVYFGYPTKSYRISGWLISHRADDGQPEVSDAEVLQALTRAGKLHGADAIIMLPTSEKGGWLSAAPPDKAWVLAHAFAITWRKPD